MVCEPTLPIWWIRIKGSRVSESENNLQTLKKSLIDIFVTISLDFPAHGRLQQIAAYKDVQTETETSPAI